MMNQTGETKPKRSAPRYWVEIKGKLYARLQYKATDGKYKVKYKPISDKRTARTAVEEMRRELQMHGQESFTSDKMTFGELAEEYRKTKLTPAVYQNGIKVSGKRSVRYIEVILKTLIAHFGQKTIRAIKAGDLETFKQKRLISITKDGRVRSIASVNRELSILRTILNFAVQNEWLLKNPFLLCQGIVALSAETERDRVLSFDEENRLLAVCTGPRAHLRQMLICALDTAMRKGEIFKMKWQHINFETNEIFIPQTNTKTEDARIIGLTPRLKSELQFLWQLSPQQTDGFVFGNINSIKTAWKTACRLADVKDFRFHDCRHTATTRMIASGSPHTEVMKITGHTQLKTFLRYLNITSETASNVAFRLNEYLSHKNISVDSVSLAVN